MDLSVQTPTHILSTGIYALGQQVTRMVGSAALTLASISWGTSNLARYYPLLLPWPYLVRRVFWANGSVAGSNVDVGVYGLDGARILSIGSTAQSGTSNLQYQALGTAVLVPAGAYYIAMSCSGTTNRAWGTATTPVENRMGGVLEQATAIPLPSPATFASASNGTGAFALFGITRTASGF